MTEYTSENIFMQNSTSGGVQWEHYTYLKKRKMVSTKFIASLAVLLYIIWQKTFFYNCFYTIYAFLKHLSWFLVSAWSVQDKDKVQDLFIIYPLFTLINEGSELCHDDSGDDVMWTLLKYLYLIFRMFAHKIFGNSASRYTINIAK